MKNLNNNFIKGRDIMNLSKSKYCNGIQCEKMLWLEKYKPEEKKEIDNQSILDNGKEVGELAKNLFGEYTDIEYNENLNIMIEDTKKQLENENIVMTEASFLYKSCFCSVDILKKVGTNYEIYEVKSATKLKNVFIDDLSFQYYVLTKLGLNVTKANIVFLNTEYTRDGELDLNKLFIIEDITNKIKEKQEKIEDNIKRLTECLEKNTEPNINLGMYCFEPYKCPFFNYCTNFLPENNVFNIKRMRNKEKIAMCNKGVYSYEDLLKEDINLKFIEQIEFELNQKEPIIKKDNIKDFLSTLEYPLYFLDFETYQQSIPLFDGIKPYMQIPFQYSLHYIENINDTLKHKEFLAEANVDPRRSLAESLVNDIPKNSCVLAYNMGFEKSVIKALSNLYPDLSEHLMNIYNNIKDLMIPFQKRDYYVKEMKGSYSIKYVLPALFPNDPTLDYHNLELIHKGDEASNAYATLGKYNKDEQQKIRECLLKYCELDTFAMVKIWKHLIEITKE